MKITILGHIEITSAIAVSIAEANIFSEIVLISNETIDDLQRAISVRRCDTKITATHQIEKSENSEIVILCPSSVDRYAKLTNSVQRSDIEIAKKIDQITPNAKFIVVLPSANLVVSRLCREIADADRRIIGISNQFVEANLKTKIAEISKISIEDITVSTIGSDREIIILLQQCRIGGIPIDQFLLPNQIDEIVRSTQKRFKSFVIQNYVKTVAAIAAEVATAIALDKKRIFTVVTQIETESLNATISVPAKIGKNGIEEIISIDLSNSQLEKFRQIVIDSVTDQKKK